jgi:hypothetical protein
LVIRRWDYFIFGGKFYGTWFKNRKWNFIARYNDKWIIFSSVISS